MKKVLLRRRKFAFAFQNRSFVQQAEREKCSTEHVNPPSRLESNWPAPRLHVPAPATKPDGVPVLRPGSLLRVPCLPKDRIGPRFAARTDAEGCAPATRRAPANCVRRRP